MKRPQRIHTYTTAGYESCRWDGFEPRRGDIIVATPVKSGTTWMQLYEQITRERLAPPLKAWLERGRG